MDEPRVRRYGERWPHEASSRPTDRKPFLPDDDWELVKDFLRSGFGQVAALAVAAWWLVVCIGFIATGHPSRWDEEVTWLCGFIAAFGVTGYLIQRALRRPE